MSQIAKISSKGQVTVPVSIRKALDAKPGGVLIWDVESEGKVIVRRAWQMDVSYLAAISGTVSEWDSAEDDEAFRDL